MTFTPPPPPLPKKKRDREREEKGQNEKRKTPQGLYKNVHNSQTHMLRHLGTEASTL
jgi:hypothetical protein